jgi:cytochrome c-type biogenesis protein CcsB
MNAEQMIQLSSSLLLWAFILYLVAGFFFVIAILGKNWSNRDPEAHKKRWNFIGFVLTLLAFASQTGYVLFRWWGQGHAPVSNMFEFMTFLGMMTALGFIIIYLIYRIGAFGAFTMPVVVTLIGWASVFDRAPTPLIPALQSHWLTWHVTLAALSEGLFAVAFAGGIMYLIRTVNQKRSTTEVKLIEFLLCTILMLVGFIGVTSVFNGMDYEISFQYVEQDGVEQVTTYTLPALVAPRDGIQLTEDRMTPLFETPGFMKGLDAGRKFNTLLWSILSGTLLYLLLRVVFRKRLAQVIHPWLEDMKPSMLDEITYRAIAIGFPIFTLGALIFAMIWAEQAWGRFWGWDPKEVWALITFLFYSVYLHLRLSRGWHGSKSAWLAVIGFLIVMFNLIVVNLLIVGLHSYASM